MLSFAFAEFSVGIGIVVMGLGEISSFFSLETIEKLFFILFISYISPVQSYISYEGHSVFLSLVVFCEMMYN